MLLEAGGVGQATKHSQQLGLICVQQRKKLHLTGALLRYSREQFQLSKDVTPLPPPNLPVLSVKVWYWFHTGMWLESSLENWDSKKKGRSEPHKDIGAGARMHVPLSPTQSEQLLPALFLA